jgi:aspartate dehydrogenase
VEQRVAIAGLGEIGRTLARRIDDGLPGFALSAVAVRDRAKAEAFLGTLRHPVPCIALGALGEHADVVIECVPAAVFRDVAAPALRAGCRLIVLSVGALLSAPDVVTLAEQFGGRIIVPTGALLGLDAVVAAAQGAIESVTMVSRKPIDGLVGAPFLVERRIDIEGLREPLRVFSGTAREAATGFPANFNVAAALSLAGIGPDRTRVEIWADPTVTRNTHRIDVESDSARFSMTIENIPSENPRTGRITALSVIALLRKMRSALTVGT